MMQALIPWRSRFTHAKRQKDQNEPLGHIQHAQMATAIPALMAETFASELIKQLMMIGRLVNLDSM
jgi:hypothetical protein